MNGDSMHRLRVVSTAVLLLVCSMSLAYAAQQTKLAEGGQALVAVVAAEQPTPAEQMAAQELVAYLEKITGAVFAVVRESEFRGAGPAIYVGHTVFAREAGVDLAKLGQEEWVIRTLGDSLLLTGGRPRGTLYAVYEFLQKPLGCYWLARDAEVVPRQTSLSIPQLNVRSQPAFAIRAISQGYYYSKDLNRDNFIRYNDFRLRNRSNYQLGAGPERGGIVVIPPNSHSFYHYVKPSLYYQEHPEYFQDDGTGRRAPGLAALFARKATAEEIDRYGGEGLCLSHPEVYAITMRSLREFIARDRARADEADRPYIYDFSQMDDLSQLCRCPECKALYEAEGSDSGPVLKFVNKMAEEIRQDYPDVMIRTFAYVSSEQPARTIKAADNVLVQYCDLYTKSDPYRALTHPVNRERLELLQRWGAGAKHLMVWDYWNFCIPVSAPTAAPPDMVPPSVIHADLNTFHDNNVMGLYAEAEGGVNVQNFLDLSYFVGYQLLVNPRQPYEPLVDLFMRGYYGPAAGPMDAFRKHLEAALAGEPGSMDYSQQAAGRQYPTAAFYAQALELLNEAERLCPAGSPERERVWREKVPVYNGLLNLWDKVATTAGGPMPFDKAALITEYEALRAALITSPANIRSDERRQEALALLADEIALLTVDLPVPEQFRAIPRERLRNVIYPNFGLWRSRLVQDDQTPARKAVVYFVEDPQTCTLPLTTGLYDDFMGLRKLPDGQPDFGPILKIESAPADEQYHWYRIGRYSIGKSTGVYGSSMFVHHPWAMRVNLHGFHTLADGIERGSKDDPNLYDVHLSLKITGPAYVPGSTKPNAIWVDRVILVRPEVR